MEDKDFTNYYEKLKLDENISLESIKKEIDNKKNEYSRKSSQAPTTEKQREAEDFLDVLDEANKVFENDKTRKDYDKKLADYKKQQENKNKKNSPKNAQERKPLYFNDLMGEVKYAIFHSSGQSVTVFLELVSAVTLFSVMEESSILLKMIWPLIQLAAFIFVFSRKYRNGTAWVWGAILLCLWSLLNIFIAHSVFIAQKSPITISLIGGTSAITNFVATCMAVKYPVEPTELFKS